MFGGNAYEDAQKQLEKYYNQGQSYLAPYNRHGQDQYKNLQTYINSFMNPTALYDQWSNAYAPSDYAKNQQALAQQEGLNDAAAMGLGGSNAALHAIQSGSAQIGMADKENYLNRLMDAYGRGANLSSGIYGVGANAAGQQSQNAMTMGQNSAMNAYGQNKGGIGGALGNLAGGIIGGIGGPIGSAIGSSIGNSLWNTFGGGGSSGELPKPFGL